ncbi:hypothetical protein MRX96_045963 [Rhipicephalus microplus]
MRPRSEGFRKGSPTYTHISERRAVASLKWGRVGKHPGAQRVRLGHSGKITKDTLRLLRQGKTKVDFESHATHTRRLQFVRRAQAAEHVEQVDEQDTPGTPLNRCKLLRGGPCEKT